MLIKENLSFYPGKYLNGGTLQNFQRDEKVVITTEFYVQEKQYIKQIRHNKVFQRDAYRLLQWPPLDVTTGGSP